jgi:tetratricopeptide (TPR) repeat protein
MQLGFILVYVYGAHGMLEAARGRLDAARAWGERAATLARKQGDPRVEGLANAYLSIANAHDGRLAEAEAHGRIAMQLLANVPPMLPIAHAARARALLGLGRNPEAVAEARLAHRILEETGAEDGEALVRLVYAECLQTVNEEDEARRVLRRACKRLSERAATIGNPVWKRSFLTRVPWNAQTVALAKRMGVIDDLT